MKNRNEYFLTLLRWDERRPQISVEGLTTRPPREEDAQALADLMLDAYHGTTDYHGESKQDAVRECGAFFAGERGGVPLLDASRLACTGSLLVGACLSVQARNTRVSLIAYAMTRAAWKNCGVGKRLLWEVLYELRNRGHHEARAVITQGNTPSERLFAGAGFHNKTREEVDNA